jgi:hypothetical protein
VEGNLDGKKKRRSNLKKWKEIRKKEKILKRGGRKLGYKKRK